MISCVAPPLSSLVVDEVAVDSDSSEPTEVDVGLVDVDVDVVVLETSPVVPAPLLVAAPSSTPVDEVPGVGVPPDGSVEQAAIAESSNHPERVQSRDMLQ
jgi:hypothetical protein